MIFFSQKQYMSGGRSPKPVVRVSASDTESFSELLRLLTRVPQSKWWGFWPTPAEPWGHNCRRSPFVMVHAEWTDWLVERGAVELPAEYANLLIGRLKMFFWEEHTAHNQRELGQGVVQYWKSKLRWLVHRIGAAGSWVADPESYLSDRLCDRGLLITLLKTTNNWVENFDRGHKRQVKPWEDSRRDSQTDSEDKPKMDQEDIPENLREYYCLSSAEQAEWLASHPWLKPMIEARK